MVKKKTLFATFIVAICLVSETCAQSFPQSVLTEMATRRMRYHHYLWHQVRENWNRFDNSTRDAFRNIGWAPPRAARNFENGSPVAIYDNNSGEDFLFMHRQMIATANDIIARNNEAYGGIRGWTTIPGPNDNNWPVPDAYTIPGNEQTTSLLSDWKSNSFYNNQIMDAERTFKDPNQLRRMSLGELGARMEVTVHSWMHMRWSASSPVGYRNGYRGTIPFVDREWDDIRYNWLGDSYSSHVNEVFFMLHGWVDDRVEDWRRANGLESIRWTGTWAGGPMDNLGSVMKESGMTGMAGMTMEGDELSDPDDPGSVLEQAFEIFMKSGVPETSMADVIGNAALPSRKRVRKFVKSCKSRSHVINK